MMGSTTKPRSKRLLMMAGMLSAAVVASWARYAEGSDDA